MFKFHSCPAIFEYLEELDFDEQFELSSFETKSESSIGPTVPNPQFFVDLETKRANKSIDDYILNRLQTTIVASNFTDL